ncbi:MAG: dTDP-4-dehydrorhamnose reductase [Proteobacteria bacterium]|nr:dTDP-4-dehydrorhamnose reductase [Pseudomonadota bacterium]
MASAPIFVTGGSGQMARTLLEEGRSRDVAIVTCGRPAFDLRSAPTVWQGLQAARPSLVVNTAAYTAVDQAEDEAELAFAVNCAGAGIVADACARLGLPLIHLSTDYVFDGDKRLPYVETDPTAPLSVYGHSKLAGERRVLLAHPAAIVLRTSWIYGRHGRNFLNAMITREVEPRLRIASDQRGSPTAAIDLARAILAIAPVLLAGRAPPGGIYHVAGAGEASRFEFAQALFQMRARERRRVPDIEPVPGATFSAKAARPAYSCLDFHKALATFNVRLPAWQESLQADLDQRAARGE